MQLRAEIQLQGIVQTMTDVILPAIALDNKLAQEQSHLIIGMLTLMAQSLSLQDCFECDELQRLIEFSAQTGLTVNANATDIPALSEPEHCKGAGKEVLEQARAEQDEIYAAIRALRVACTSVVRSALAGQAEMPCGKALKQVVLDVSKEQLIHERPWAVTRGFGRDPKGIPPIGDLISSLSPLRCRTA